MARIIDTHCHVGLHKYEPLETLIYHMNRAGVEGAVFIQYMGNSDNSYLVDCLRRHPGRFAAAMIAPTDDDGTAIRTWAEQGIGGIRLAANARATGVDPLAQWRTANELGLVVSAPCSVDSLLSVEFAELVQAFPELSIVIEHLAGAKRDLEPPYTDFKKALELARFPNLTIKLPGFGEFYDLTALFHGALGENQAELDAALASRDPALFAPIPPLADLVLEAFGPNRIMWGSDWPPVSSREGYDSSLAVPRAWASTLSQTEQDAIFGETASRVWKV
ncbi:MAG: amidohydrolase family protein [Caldilineaceae bacterium]